MLAPRGDHVHVIIRVKIYAHKRHNIRVRQFAPHLYFIKEILWEYQYTVDFSLRDDLTHLNS